MGIVLITVLLSSLAIWGIVESAAVAVAITVIEIAGLIFVVFAGRSYLLSLHLRWDWLPLTVVARMTSAIILVVYAAVDLALVVIKSRDPRPGPEVTTWPAWVPVIGLVLSLGFIGVQLWVLAAGSTVAP